MTSGCSWTSQIQNISLVAKSSVGRCWSRESRASFQTALWYVVTCPWGSAASWEFQTLLCPSKKGSSGVFYVISWTASYNSDWRKHWDTTRLEKRLGYVPLNTVTFKGASKSLVEAVSFTFCTSDLNLECNSELPIKSRAKFLGRMEEPNKGTCQDQLAVYFR